MKINSIITSAFCLMVLAMISCTSQPDKALVDSLISENDSHRYKVTEMQTFYEKTVSEYEKEKKESFEKIDPKKKTAFNNDKGINERINYLEDGLKKRLEEYRGLTDSMFQIVENNSTYFKNIPQNDLNNDDLNRYWKAQNEKVMEISLREEDILKRVMENKAELSKVLSKVIEQYGIKNKTTRKGKS